MLPQARRLDEGVWIRVSERETGSGLRLGATHAPVDDEIQNIAANFRCTPTEISVKPGETVRFVVTNDDVYLHNFVSQAAGIPYLALPGGTTQTVTWAAPARSGAFTAECSLQP